MKSGRGKTIQSNFIHTLTKYIEFVSLRDQLFRRYYEIVSWPFAKSISIEQFCLLELCNNKWVLV